MTTLLQLAENLLGFIAAVGCMVLASVVVSGIFWTLTHGPWARHAVFND